jgi:hypothetical protein
MTSYEKLVRVGKDYGKLLMGFVGIHNGKHGLDSELHIFNLIQKADGEALREQGYGISLKPTTWASILPNLYVENQDAQAWVHKTLLGKGFDYKTLEEGIVGTEDNEGLLETVHGECYEDKTAQRGLCVVGNNVSVDKFEAHPYGREVIIPRFFGLITLVAKYDPETLVFDRSSARLVYMPIVGPEGQFSYVFEPNTGHYAPNVFGVAEVILPDGTGGPLDAEEKAANKKGKIFASHNIILGSASAKPKKKKRSKKKAKPKKAAVQVVGETKTTDVLKKLQKQIDDAVKPKLQEMLSD